ncbi:hypothetical protein ACRV89_004749, partial [Salmonella enterica subsp. enterica serovar Newport]
PGKDTRKSQIYLASLHPVRGAMSAGHGATGRHIRSRMLYGSETQRTERSYRMKNSRKNQGCHHREPGIRHSSHGRQKK